MKCRATYLFSLAVMLYTVPAWAQADATHPLAGIASRMHETAGRLALPDSGTETQAAQKEIIEALDAQIKRARQQCAQAQKQNDQQATKPRQPVSQPGAQGDGPGEPGTGPARQSVERNGRTNGQPADLPAVRELAKRLWGELPDREREQLIQASIETLLPKYETMIEQYFRRLAEP